MDRLKEIETRLAEIRELAENPETENYSELAEEVRTLKAEKAEIEKKIEQRKALLDDVAQTGKTIEDFEELRGKKDMEIETRNTKEYINAYAEYIKSGDDAECRALLSTNGTDPSASLTGYVPVPDMVEGRIRHAWEKSELMSLVKKTFVKGNVKVGFELTADGALIHNEGAAAGNEEVITLGIVTLVPKSIKKWITISDEALDLTGEEFLNYIYDELTYRIAQKAEDILVGLIAAAPTTATSTAVSVPQVTTAPALDAVAKALSLITSEARNIVLVMNRQTWAAFKKEQYDGNYGIDIFENCKVYFNNTLPAYSAADAGDVYMIAGDFGLGAQANFPSGEQISVKVDNLSLAEKDLVKFVGREYVGIGLVNDKAFVNAVKPSS